MNIQNQPDPQKPKPLLENEKMKYLLWILVILSVVARLYNIYSPPFDLFAHPFRQSQTLATIEDFFNNGINMFYPKTNYNGYPGYFVLEFPIFQAMAAFIWKWVGPSIAYIRLLNILFGLFSAYITFLIARKYFDENIAYFSLAIYLFIPLNVLYQRSVLIEPMAVFFSLLAFYQTLIYLEKPNHVFNNVLLFFSYVLIGLMKPIYLFPTIVLLIYIFAKKRRVALLPLASLITCSIVFLAWNSHARQVNSASYFTSGGNILAHLGISSLLSPVYYFTLAWRIINNYFNPVGLLPFAIAIFGFSSLSSISRDRIKLFFLIIISYLILFANINNPHNYYQLVIMPYLSIIMGSGLALLYKFINENQSTKIIVLVITAFVIATGYNILSAKLFILDSNLVNFKATVQNKIDKNSYGIILAGNKPATTMGTALGIKQDNVYGNASGFMYAAGLNGSMLSEVDASILLKKFSAIYPNYKGHLKYIILQDLGKNSSTIQRNLKKKLKLESVMQTPETVIFRLIK